MRLASAQFAVARVFLRHNDNIGDVDCEKKWPQIKRIEQICHGFFFDAVDLNWIVELLAGIPHSSG